MNERSDNSRQPRRRKNSFLLEENWWKKYGKSNKTRTEDSYAKTDDEEFVEKLNKIQQFNFNYLYGANGLMRNKLKKTHETKENHLEKSSASSQKTRKFDERVKATESIFNNKSGINLDFVKKFKQMDQKLEENDLSDIIKILKKTVEDSVPLLKQKKYIEFEKNNMQKIRQLVNELQNNYYQREYENLLAQEPKYEISEHEYEMQNFRNKKNSHDIIKYCSKIYKLKNKIKEYKKKFEIHKLKDIIETNKRKKWIKKREALKKKVALWKERYAKSETALATVTANNQNAKQKLFEFKDCILYVASEVAVCLKQATTLIFDKLIMKDEEQLFVPNCMLQQYTQMVSSTENLNNNTLMTDEILPKMIETSVTKIVDELSDKIKNLSNHEDISNDLNAKSPKKLLPQVSKMLSNTDNENRKCELTKQLGDEQQTNVDNKSTNVEQVEINTKETHDMKETKKHDKDSEILPFYFTPLYSDILEDYCTLKGYKIHNNKLIDNSKFNELLEEDKNVNVDCKNIRKSPESTVSSKPSKSLKSVVKITPVEQCHTPAVQDMCTYCNLSKTIFANIEN